LDSEVKHSASNEYLRLSHWCLYWAWISLSSTIKSYKLVWSYSGFCRSRRWLVRGKLCQNGPCWLKSYSGFCRSRRWLVREKLC